MNTWFGSFFLAIFALTLGAAQDFDLDTDRLLMDGMAKRRVAELIGKRDGMTGFGREVRRTRELFGKRSYAPLQYPSTDIELPAKRRHRELLGKRSVEVNSLTNDQMEMLASMIMERSRRRAGGELFG